MATVIGLFICADKGLPMLAQQEVKALAGIGLEGDRYANEKGAFSQSKRVTTRHVSLIDASAIAEANKGLAEAFTFAETRRNIITQGIDLHTLIGKEFLVGTVVMKGVELCDPCGRPSSLAGKRGFEVAFQQKGGLRAEILTNGVIHINDPITT